MTKFLALDFETGDERPDSACAVGLVRVENGCVVYEQAHLIRPPREHIRFTHIHGLSWEDVCHSPTFPELWPKISHLFEGLDFVAAHNSSFDRRVLMACLEAHGLKAPPLTFKCTVQISRRAFGIYPTKLSNVCQVLGINLKHHEALSDAKACAEIVLRAEASSP